MKKMALVLQGGGALGAFEYGVVTKLVELGWQRVAGVYTAGRRRGSLPGDERRGTAQFGSTLTPDRRRISRAGHPARPDPAAGRCRDPTPGAPPDPLRAGQQTQP